MCNAFHTILNQELVHVTVWGHKEVSGVHFCDYELDLEIPDKVFGFTQLHDRLFQVMIARHRGYNHINMLVLSN